MRIIKFRGKRVDTGEWVCGFVSEYQSKTIISSEIIENPSYSDPAGSWSYVSNEVIPETVCQFTGLTDKNGKEIYEGDVLRITITDAIHFHNVLSTSTESVEFQNGCFGVVYGLHRDFTKFDGFHNTTFEVIGTIHDNPELIK